MDNLFIWAAGMLDADGTITIGRYLTQKAKHFYYRPIIQVSQANTFKGIKNIERMSSLFKGNISYTNPHFPSRRNGIIKWQLVSLDAFECAKKIQPYMAGKSRQVDLLVEYSNKFLCKKRDSYRTSNEILLEQDKFFFTMRTFQEKGFSPTTTKRKDRLVKPDVIV